MDIRVAARLAQYKSLNVVMDYDNTITNGSKPLSNLSGIIQANPLAHLETLIPGSVFAEPILKEKGRGKFAEVFANTWQLVIKDKIGYNLVRAAGNHVPLREGVNNFFAYAKKIGVDLTIVSANFEPFVMGGLDQIDEAEETQLIAVNDKSILSTAKGDVLLHLAQKNPSKAFVFVGDGASDLPALKANEFIACYFALEGSEFEKALKKENLPYFTYRDFNDITLKLHQLNTINNRPTS